MTLGEIVDGYLIHLRHHLGQLLPDSGEQSQGKVPHRWPDEYGDEQIAQWDGEDALADEVRTHMLDELPTPKTT